MERKRCQVCDGPVVNGRCKLCGMPYRNDEILYHLNESRSDHYSHATRRAQAIMRQDEIPLGDKKPGAGNAAGKSYKQSTAVTGKSYKQSTVTAGKNYKQNTGNQYGQKSGNKTRDIYTQKPVKKKKGSFLTWLIILAAICVGVPEIRDVFQNELIPVIEQELGTNFAPSASYAVKQGDALSVGNDDWDDILPGQYSASCEDGFVSFLILGDDGETGGITVNNGENRKITLKEGDMIGIISSETEDSVLLLTAR